MRTLVGDAHARERRTEAGTHGDGHLSLESARTATPVRRAGPHPKVAVITGAGSGLGRAIAWALHKHYTLALCGRTRKALSEVTGEITAAGGTAMARQVDMKSCGKVCHFLDDVQKFYGRVDVLVNNAGVVHGPLNLQETDPHDMEECFETNVYGPFYAMQHLLPAMISRYRSTSERSVIINIASKAARWPTPRMSAYSASKAALVALTQAVAKELQATEVGVKVVSISPGGMDTAMRAQVAGEEDAKQQQSAEFVASVVRDIVTGQRETPNGANVLVWKKEVKVYPMEDVR